MAQYYGGHEFVWMNGMLEGPYPKGITRNTLYRVCEAIRHQYRVNKNRPTFTMTHADYEDTFGIDRKVLSQYLDFLVSKGRITVERGTGRAPVITLKYLPPTEKIGGALKRAMSKSKEQIGDA